METKKDVIKASKGILNEYDRMFDDGAAIHNWLSHKNLSCKRIQKDSELPKINENITTVAYLIEKDCNKTIWTFATCAFIVKKYQKDYPDLGLLVQNIYRIIKSISGQKKFLQSVKLTALEYTIEGPRLSNALKRDLRKSKARNDRLKTDILPIYIEYCGLSEYIKYLASIKTSLDKEIEAFHYSDKVQSIDFKNFDETLEGTSVYDYIDQMFFDKIMEDMNEHGIEYCGISNEAIKYMERLAKERDERKEDLRISKLAEKFSAMRDCRNRVIREVTEMFENGNPNKDHTTIKAYEDMIMNIAKNDYHPAYAIMWIRPYTNSRAIFRWIQDPLKLENTANLDVIAGTKRLIEGIVYGSKENEESIISRLDNIINSLKVAHKDDIIERITIGPEAGIIERAISIQKLKKDPSPRMYDMNFVKNISWNYIGNIVEDLNAYNTDTAKVCKAISKREFNAFKKKCGELPDFREHIKTEYGWPKDNNITVLVVAKYHRILTRNEADLTEEEINNPTTLFPEDTPDATFATIKYGFVKFMDDTASRSIYIQDFKREYKFGRLDLGDNGSIEITDKLSEAFLLRNVSYYNSSKKKNLISNVWDTDKLYFYIVNGGLDIYVLKAVKINTVELGKSVPQDTIKKSVILTAKNYNISTACTIEESINSINKYSGQKYYGNVSGNMLTLWKKLLDFRSRAISIEKNPKRASRSAIIYAFVNIIVFSHPWEYSDKFGEGYEYGKIFDIPIQNNNRICKVFIGISGFYNGDNDSVKILSDAITNRNFNTSIDGATIFRLCGTNSNRHPSILDADTVPVKRMQNAIDQLRNMVKVFKTYIPIEIDLDQLYKNAPSKSFQYESDDEDLEEYCKSKNILKGCFDSVQEHIRYGSFNSDNLKEWIRSDIINTYYESNIDFIDDEMYKLKSEISLSLVSVESTVYDDHKVRFSIMKLRVPIWLTDITDYAGKYSDLCPYDHKYAANKSNASKIRIPDPLYRSLSNYAHDVDVMNSIMEDAARDTTSEYYKCLSENYMPVKTDKYIEILVDIPGIIQYFNNVSRGEYVIEVDTIIHQSQSIPSEFSGTVSFKTVTPVKTLRSSIAKK